MNKYKIILIGLLCSFQSQAQNQSDILRYSQSYNMGTARSQGVGGAFGSVGADFSSVYINPAGLALYRRSEFNFSGAITANTATSDFLGQSSIDTRTNFNIPSFGVVFSKVNTGLQGGDASEGIVNYNFGFGYNRTNNFQQNIYAEGYNTKSNISQFYVQQANGTPYNQFAASGTSFDYASMAWNTYLIDTAANNTSYYSPWFGQDNNYKLLQSQQISRRGSVGEYNFNGSLNIGNMVYFGAGLVLSSVRYESTETFTESDPDKTVIDPNYGHLYNSSSLKSELTSTGNGVAGRFGVIFRPIDNFRFGFAAQTATRIAMTDNYKYTITSDINWTGIGQRKETSPDGEFSYNIITPAKYTASASFMHPDVGFLSVDVDMIDYSRGRLTSDNHSFSQQNAAARNSFQEAYNMRLGGEVKLTKMYRMRAGYSLHTSPYKSIAGVSASDLARHGYSLGLGYTNGQHFIDFASVVTTYKEYNTPYLIEGGYSPTATINNVLLNFVVTGGVKF